MELGRHEEAAEWLEAAVRLYPQGDTYRFDLGRTLYELGRLEAACAAFRWVVGNAYVWGMKARARE